MPLIAIAALSVAAGLLMGFSGASFFPALLSLIMLVVAVRRRTTSPAAVALLLMAGVFTARAQMNGAEECAETLPSAARWVATLDRDAAPGTFLTAVVTDGACSLRAAIAVEKGSGAAGERVSISGSVLRGERGLVIQRAEVTPDGGSSLLLRLRAAAARTIDRDYGSSGRAGVVKALLIAESREIDGELRDRFADAGLVHMLSISGLHVGIIAGAAQLLLRAIRLPAVAAIPGAAFVTVFYVLIIGAPAPAVRAAVMLIAVGASRLLQRPSSPWAALALGAIVPLTTPETVLTLGYQLSLTGMVGLICAGKVSARVTGDDSVRWRAAMVSSLIATLLASLATAPIIAWHFGRISLIAPATNLAAAPLMVLLQPMLFLVLILAPVPSLSSFVADATLPLLSAFEWIATAGSAPGWSAIDVAPTLSSVVLASGAAGGVVAASISRRPARYLIVGAACVCAIVWTPLVPAAAEAGRLEVHLIDVGQGDAVAVRLPDRNWLLFDAGRSWAGGDAGRRVVIPYIRRRGGELHGFILSHPHSDHVGGAASVVRWLKPRHFWDAAFVAGNADYLAALEAARDARTQWSRVRPPETIAVGGASLQFLAPDSAWTVSLADPNEASTIAMVRLGDVRIMLTGDAERGEEEWLLRRYPGLLRADVLKVAHHGSRTSSTEQFIGAVMPRVALVSVGAGNRYGHPVAEVMEGLSRAGAVVLRTDLHGSVVISTDGRRIWVEAMGDRWVLP